MHKSELVPPLPDLVTRLLGLLSHQETEPADLERLLQNDQVLVAKMLAMVNSPFYGLNRTVGTVKEAVMVLGFRGVRSLVLATTTAKFLQRDYSCYGHEPKGLWLHAVCVASGARHLARRCGMLPDESEQLFVCGLMHDIGKLLLVPYVQLDPGASCERAVVEHERATVGLDHAEAGALVTAKWNLSDEIQYVIRAHHEHDYGPGDPRPVAIVRLVDAVANAHGVGYLPGRAPVNEVFANDLAVCGLTGIEWSGFTDELIVTMDEAVTALGNLGC